MKSVTSNEWFFATGNEWFYNEQWTTSEFQQVTSKEWKAAPHTWIKNQNRPISYQ